MTDKQDFEKGWEDYKAQRKQQIEEMAKIIYGYPLDQMSDCQYVASVLLKHYQPKLPEGSVVLTKEQNEKWEKFLNQNIDKACKKKAREIFTKLIEVAKNEYNKGSLPIGTLKAWAIEFGVEVK